MGRKIQANEILLDFWGDVGKKTVEQLIISHNNLLKQRDELLDKVKYLTRALEAVHSMGASKPIIQGAKDLITKIEQK